jgi:hypothetical protein
VREWDDLPEEERRGILRRCLLRVILAGGAAFVALGEASENLERVFYVPAIVWIVFGTFLAICWAYEWYCRGGRSTT